MSDCPELTRQSTQVSVCTDTERTQFSRLHQTTSNSDVSESRLMIKA